MQLLFCVCFFVVTVTAVDGSNRIGLLTPMPFGAIHEITGGNHGSMRVALDLYKKWNDPLRLLELDRPLFYDERLWLAYKDVCREDIHCVEEFIDDIHGGKITEEQAVHAMNNRGDGWVRTAAGSRRSWVCERRT